MAVTKGGVVEFIPESVFGQFEGEAGVIGPRMKWIGLVQKYSLPTKEDEEEYRALGAYGDTTTKQIKGALGHGEIFEADFDYIPQSFEFFGYVMDDVPITATSITPGAQTITFTNGSATVTGSTTTFLTDLVTGSLIRSDTDGIWVYVKSVESNTSLTLQAIYPGTGGAGQEGSRMDVVPTLTDTLKSLSIGETSNSKFRRNCGVFIDSAKFSVQRNKKAIISGKAIVADVPRTVSPNYDPWSVNDFTTKKFDGTTYTTAGTHTVINPRQPYKWSDVTGITYGGTNFIASVEKIEFEVKNNLDITYDNVTPVYGSTLLNTRVYTIDPDKRDLSVTFGVKHKDVNSIVKKVLEFSAADIVLTIAGKTLTFTGARIPEEPFELAPTGFQGQDIKFVGITNFTITGNN